MIADFSFFSLVLIFSSYSTKRRHFVFLLNLNFICSSVVLSTNSIADGNVSLILIQFFKAFVIDLYSITKRILFFGMFFIFNFAERIIPKVPSAPIIIL